MLRQIWDFLTDRRQLSMRDRESGEVHWKLNLSPLALWGSVFTLVVIIVVGLMLLIAYTNVLDIFPSYRTKNEAMHDNMVSAIMRLDEMEQNMADKEEYYDALARILNGSTPASQSTTMLDDTRYDKSTVERNDADSLLRAKLESEDDDYSLTNTKRPKIEAPIFVKPIDGLLSRGFDSSQSDYDIAMTPTADATVMAIDSGTVIGLSDMNDGYAVVVIQHAGGYVSVYRNLSEVLVRRGQPLKSGAAIGRVGSVSQDDTAHVAELVFELWRDGVAVNPEPYIFGKGR
jgi:murein DD-endopeptidase MepM/ murein hydrolase activator NlpD